MGVVRVMGLVGGRRLLAADEPRVPLSGDRSFDLMPVIHGTPIEIFLNVDNIR